MVLPLLLRLFFFGGGGAGGGLSLLKQVKSHVNQKAIIYYNNLLLTGDAVLCIFSDL